MSVNKQKPYTKLAQIITPPPPCLIIGLIGILQTKWC